MSNIDNETVHARTADISSGGFYCRSQRGFAPGEELTALIDIPAPSGGPDSVSIVLRCHVHVVRVEPLNCEDGWGVACQILDYSVLSPERAGH